MKYLKRFNESEDWRFYEQQGKMKKTLRSKLSLLGKRVRRPGKQEEGVIVVDSYDGEEPEYFIMYSEDDLEGLLGGLLFEIWDEQRGRFVKDHNGINPHVNLTEEEKDFLNLSGPNKQVLKNI